MALLDVTGVLLDPAFADRLVCERFRQVVGDNGIAVNTAQTLKLSGVVTSDNGDILERIATGERIKGSIIVHTRFILFDGTSGYTADIVQWRGRRYTVSNVNDYSHFGRGFIAASCDLIPLSG